jgi:hypothetical protein
MIEVLAPVLQSDECREDGGVPMPWPDLLSPVLWSPNALPA